MSMEISYPNTGLISPNYDAINKANKILAGKTAEDLKANTSGTMQEISTEEVREMREKARNEQRTLNVDRSEIVNNVYWKTGDNITYNVDGVSFTNEEMKACKEVVKNAIAALPTKGSDLDYEDCAAMGIAANMVNTYATEHLTVEQAEVINKSINDYLDSLVQAEKERHAQSGYFIDDTKGVGSTGELNKYYAVRQQLSEGAAESLRSQITSNLPENTRNTLLDNLEHASKQGSVVQSFTNDVSTLLTTESTSCVYETADPDDDDIRYITWYTEEGIFCRKAGQTEGYEWSITFENKEQYDKVMEFIGQFPSDWNMRFAAHENFWNDFLNDEIDMVGFMEFINGTNKGIPDYSITVGDSMYIDKDKMQWAKYTNPLGARFFTAEEMYQMQMEIIAANEEKLKVQQVSYEEMYKRTHPDYNGERIFRTISGGQLYTANEIDELLYKEMLERMGTTEEQEQQKREEWRKQMGYPGY